MQADPTTNAKSDTGGSRNLREVIAIARVTQANLVQLALSDARRRHIELSQHELRVPPPGAILQFRDVLIDRGKIANYDDIELRLRLREIWGRFCLLCWYLGARDPAAPPKWESVVSACEPRCEATLRVKTAEIEGTLWRMLVEQRLRDDAAYRQSSEFASHWDRARQIPAKVYDSPVTDCAKDALIACSCEHAGMLAAARWIGDPSLRWDDPMNMVVSNEWYQSESTADGSTESINKAGDASGP